MRETEFRRSQEKQKQMKIDKVLMKSGCLLKEICRSQDLCRNELSFVEVIPDCTYQGGRNPPPGYLYDNPTRVGPGCKTFWRQTHHQKQPKKTQSHSRIC